MNESKYPCLTLYTRAYVRQSRKDIARGDDDDDDTAAAAAVVAVIGVQVVVVVAHAAVAYAAPSSLF